MIAIEHRRKQVLKTWHVVLEEVSKRQEALVHRPGRVNMLEFVWIKRASVKERQPKRAGRENQRAAHDGEADCARSTHAEGSSPHVYRFSHLSESPTMPSKPGTYGSALLMQVGQSTEYARSSKDCSTLVSKGPSSRFDAVPVDSDVAETPRHMRKKKSSELRTNNGENSCFAGTRPGTDLPAAALVSVILPTFNRSRFLPAAFRAILAQQITSWELIVIDDGSTDDTRQVVEALSASVSQPVTYLRQDNQGAYGARNTGLDAARGSTSRSTTATTSGCRTICRRVCLRWSSSRTSTGSTRPANWSISTPSA